MIFRSGDSIHITSWQSKPGEGLTYGTFDAIALEDGASDGWDVYEVRDITKNKEDGAIVSVYGHSIKERRPGTYMRSSTPSINHCDNGHDTKLEIRILSLGENANALVCRNCFDHQINDWVSRGDTRCTQEWSKLKVHDESRKPAATTPSRTSRIINMNVGYNTLRAVVQPAAQADGQVDICIFNEKDTLVRTATLSIPRWRRFVEMVEESIASN
jgi:hypothetical protein